MIPLALWASLGLFALAILLFLSSRSVRNRTERMRLENHARRDELVAEAKALAGPGEYVFALYFESILYIGAEKPAMVKVTRRNGGFEKLEVAPFHVLGVRLNPDPVESVKRGNAPLGPQHDRLLVVSLVGAPGRTTFYFDSADTAREWRQRVEAFAASAQSGSTTLRS